MIPMITFDARAFKTFQMQRPRQDRTGPAVLLEPVQRGPGSALFALEISGMFCYHGRAYRVHMQKADLTTRAVAGFIDLLIVIGLARLPDVIGFLAASGYILIRDGLFKAQSVGKKLIGLRIALADEPSRTATFRESLLRNAPLAVAFLLFLVPYAGWVLGSAVVCIEALTSLGDDRGMRVGDLVARTWTVRADLPVVPPAGPPSSQESAASREGA